MRILDTSAWSRSNIRRLPSCCHESVLMRNLEGGQFPKCRDKIFVLQLESSSSKNYAQAPASLRCNWLPWLHRKRERQTPSESWPSWCLRVVLFLRSRPDQQCTCRSHMLMIIFVRQPTQSLFGHCCRWPPIFLGHSRPPVSSLPRNLGSCSKILWCRRSNPPLIESIPACFLGWLCPIPTGRCPIVSLPSLSSMMCRVLALSSGILLCCPPWRSLICNSCWLQSCFGYPCVHAWDLFFGYCLLRRHHSS